jgi:hypothetical protein
MDKRIVIYYIVYQMLSFTNQISHLLDINKIVGKMYMKGHVCSLNSNKRPNKIKTDFHIINKRDFRFIFNLWIS